MVLRVKWGNQEILARSVTKDQKAAMVMLVEMVNGVYPDTLEKTAFQVRLEVPVKTDYVETKEQRATMAVWVLLDYREGPVYQECAGRKVKKASLWILIQFWIWLNKIVMAKEVNADSLVTRVHQVPLENEAFLEYLE